MASIERSGSVTVVRPNRPLQRDSLVALTTEVNESIRSGVPLVVMDLAETPLIDSAGLEWLLDLDDQCSNRGGCVCVCHANELCRDILRITCVGASMQQFPDLTSALGSFA